MKICKCAVKCASTHGVCNKCKGQVVVAVVKVTVTPGLSRRPRAVRRQYQAFLEEQAADGMPKPIVYRLPVAS